MERVVKFRYRYTDGVNWKFVVCTLPEILNGKPIDEMSDNPLLKHFKHVGEDQFTGLLDKNGVEIYEDDIIQYKEYHVNKKWWSTASEIHEIKANCQKQREDFWTNKRKVEFRDGCFVLDYGLTLQDVERGFKHTFGQSNSCDTEEKIWDFEIIGNIYSNPELLSTK